MRTRVAASVAVVGLVLSSARLAAAEDAAAFSVQEIESRGRTVTAEIADLDGDGRQDLLQAVTFEMPPDERRVLRVHLQAADGSIPATPTLVIPIPSESAAYDMAEADGVPGSDLLLLRPRGIGIVSFVRGDDGSLLAKVRDAKVPDDLTIGVSSDERGLDRLQIAFGGLGERPWLVAPGLGETFLLDADGTLRARIASGARANFFVPPSGPILSESDIQIFLDAPRITVGDVNGDGRADLIASQRHQLLLFYRNEDGSFDHDASRALELGRLSFEDHIRGSGAVRSAARDIDGDGLADLIVSVTKGGLLNASFDTSLYFNRGSGWDLQAADYSFASPAVLGADQLIDIDGDGRLELLRIGIPLNVLELIEIFATQALDANLTVYGIERPQERPEQANLGAMRFELKIDLPLDFETSRPVGFVPTVEYDFNGDGVRDYITSGNGKRLDVFVGDPVQGFPSRSARQTIGTEGQIRPGDLNGDGLTDLVLFNSRRDNQPVRLLTNRGELPGTRVKPVIEAPPE